MSGMAKRSTSTGGVSPTLGWWVQTTCSHPLAISAFPASCVTSPPVAVPLIFSLA